MDVEKLFWEDPYLTELTANITSCSDNSVTLDKTIAYAFSGGQESDHGTIHSYPITAAEKKDKQIIYFLPECAVLKVGDSVCIRINWERRYKLMRLHFAAEILLELVNQWYNAPLKIGAHIGEDKARLDFIWQENISQIFPDLLAKANRIIQADFPIISAFYNREKEIRYWEVENFAKVLCGGTHIRRTGEVGNIALRRNNIGKNKERIEITLV